jgi:hypothetical protein
MWKSHVDDIGIYPYFRRIRRLHKIPSRPNRGVSVQHLQMRGGGRGLPLSVGDAAPETRRPKLHASRRTGRAPPGLRDGRAGSWSQDLPVRSGPTAVDRRPSNSKGEAGCLKWDVRRGRCRASLQTPRAGRHRTWRTCGLPVVARKGEDGNRTSTSLDVARRRGPRVRLGPWRPARPRYFRGPRQADGPARGLANNTGDGARPRHGLFDNRIGDARRGKFSASVRKSSQRRICFGRGTSAQNET